MQVCAKSRGYFELLALLYLVLAHLNFVKYRKKLRSCSSSVELNSLIFSLDVSPRGASIASHPQNWQTTMKNNGANCGIATTRQRPLLAPTCRNPRQDVPMLSLRVLELSPAGWRPPRRPGSHRSCFSLHHDIRHPSRRHRNPSSAPLLRPRIVRRASPTTPTHRRSVLVASWVVWQRATDALRSVVASTS